MERDKRICLKCSKPIYEGEEYIAEVEGTTFPIMTHAVFKGTMFHLVCKEEKTDVSD